MKNKGINITLTCDHCGKPISKSTDFGMECEDECGKKIWEKATGVPFDSDKEINDLFNKPLGPSGVKLNDLLKNFGK